MVPISSSKKYNISAAVPGSTNQEDSLDWRDRNLLIDEPTQAVTTKDVNPTMDTAIPGSLCLPMTARLAPRISLQSNANSRARFSIWWIRLSRQRIEMHEVHITSQSAPATLRIQGSAGSPHFAVYAKPPGFGSPKLSIIYF